MEVINENCAQIQYLNLSHNALPQHQEWCDAFIEHLLNMINVSSKLILLNLSGMNFRENVKAIQWPLSKSKTLQSIHLSDNNIPKAVETNLLMVFGIKSSDSGDELSIAGKLDPRQYKKNPMTGFQIKMQQRLEAQKEIKKSGTAEYNQHFDKFAFGTQSATPDSEMILTYDDATAKIANAVEIRDMKQDKNFL